MKLRAALIGPSRPWEELLRQEGLPWDVVDPREKDLGEYSVAIIHRRLDPMEREGVEEYLRKGGGILGGGSHAAELCAAEGRDEYLEYIVGEGKFPNIHLLDLGLRGKIPREASECRTGDGSNAIFAGELRGGVAVLLPFSPAAALADERSVVKAFYAPQDRLPAERVSLVAKGELRHLVHASLEYLHLERGIPYAHLWYFPDGCANVFGFRVDTDGAGRDDVTDLYRVAQAHRTRMSWFLDVRSDRFHLEQFAAMTGQEIGLHCFEHREPTDERTLRQDLEKGMEILTAAGFHPEGYAATYGFWRPFVSTVAQDLGFRYSSEFSCGYDTLPFLPTGAIAAHGVLQIPVHPVCTGTLRQAGYTERGMAEYFRRVVATKRGRGEPLLFYHHPSHRAWDVVGELCREGEADGTRQLTFGEYAAWWERRNAAPLRIDFHEGELRCSPADVLRCSSEGLTLRVARRPGGESLLQPAERISLDLLSWHDTPAVPPPPDIRRAREFDLRRGLGSLFTSMMRRRR